MSLRPRYKILLLVCLGIFNVFAFSVLSQSKSDELKIYFLDVGQGDAIFIETPARKQVLIDGGPDSSVIQRLSEIMRFWDRTIDLVILTHPDSDHVIGLIEVLKRYKVKGVIETGIACENPQCLAWRDLVGKEKAPAVAAQLGQAITLDENTKIHILHPFDNLVGEKLSKTNNTSIVARLNYGSYSVLLTGDIEKQVENKLILAGIDIDTDYVKIPHHGSKTSTTEELLGATSPLMAFISLGKGNPYGHPHSEVIERLEKRNIKYLRTDQEGNILLSCKLDQPCEIK